MEDSPVSKAGGCNGRVGSSPTSRTKLKMITKKEILIHFMCEYCNKWWSIGDAPIDTKKKWYCPWCGKEQRKGGRVDEGTSLLRKRS